MRYLLLFIIFIFPATFAANIIVDLEDFLMYEVRTRTIRDVGFFHFCGFYNPVLLKRNFFETLDLAYSPQKKSLCVMRDGLPLPQIIKEWLSNEKPAHVCKSIIASALKQYASTSGVDTTLYQAITAHLFDPVRYAKVRDYRDDGWQILKDIYTQTDRYGKRLHKIYILSNQNTETFKELSKNPGIQKILSVCNGVIISGDAHMLKPDPQFFSYAFDKWGISPAELTIYIDSEVTYVNAVQQLKKNNFYCIVATNAKCVRSQLKKLSIFKS